MTETICEKCGSREITTKECYKKTVGPKNKKTTNKKITYGYKFIKYTCNTCNHNWDI